jgi:hypothetical protein
MELGVDVSIWMNVLIFFREIDPPELFREYGLKQTEFDLKNLNKLRKALP